MLELDPTLEEMRSFLKSSAGCYDAEEFDVEEAIYWFANDYHGGQMSNLYEALCASEYRPGPIATGPDPDGISQFLYEELEAKFIPELRIGWRE